MTTENTGPVPFVSVLADMAWHTDPLVRDIASEIDDREIGEIASAIHDLVFGSDDAWDEAMAENPDVELLRSLAEPVGDRLLPLERAQAATLLASRIIDWCNYGEAYGDLSDPPWEEEEEEEEDPEPDPDRHVVIVRIDHRQPMSAMETARSKLAARFGADAAFGFLSFSDETIDISEHGMPIRERTFVFCRIK